MLKLIIEKFVKYKDKRWKGLYKCKCFNYLVVSNSAVTFGNTKSCGCHRIESSIRRATKHGHGKVSNCSRTYKSWANMKTRCMNQRYKWYHNYGGRGIDICERWLKFENFLADMGERPENKSLDRINNEIGYSPENCRWATSKEQNNNTRKQNRSKII